MKTGYGNAQKSSLHPTDCPNRAWYMKYLQWLTRRDLAHIRQPCTMTKSKLQAACNLPYRSKRLYDGDGKSETYLVEVSMKRPSPNIAIVEYTREASFQRKGRRVEITIKRYAP